MVCFRRAWFLSIWIAQLRPVYYNTFMENLEIAPQLMKGCWLIGVSGGGDSMALLDLCRRKGVSLRCAHVNYHHRDTADRDQHLCERYCAKWSIPIHVLHADTSSSGNFQANARKERYAFYHQLCGQYSCEGVLVAHQQDDVLETYLMQKQRGSLPSYYGMKEEGEVYGVRVIRPLLAYTRKQLRAYNARYEVPFEEDESNFSDDYERNRIRHHLIEKMDQQARCQLLKQIEDDNQHLIGLTKEAEDFLTSWDGTCALLMAHPRREYLLQYWIRSICQISLSASAQKDVFRRLKDGKAQWMQQLDAHWVLKKEYDLLKLDKLEMCAFCYTYDALCYADTPHFQLCREGERIEGVTVQKEDFPIMIRPVQPGDAIQLRFGRKKIHRWFIDRHIPLNERSSWPVMVNVSGEVIFVPKIGCDVAHFSNNPNLFMIQ